MTVGQGHRHLGHWMRLIRLYLGTKYEVCRWNSIQDMASLVFNYLTSTHFEEILTFSQGHHHLSYWMCLITIRMYLGTKYEVCIWNIYTKIWENLTFNIRLLGHWMRLTELYLGTKYEVCRRNSIGVHRWTNRQTHT